MVVPPESSDHSPRPEDQIATAVRTSCSGDNVDYGFALLGSDLCIPEHKLKNNETMQAVATSDDNLEDKQVFYRGSAFREASVVIKVTNLQCRIIHPDTLWTFFRGPIIVYPRISAW